jgi:predicted GIY-YIG superfamily endonuclease
MGLDSPCAPSSPRRRSSYLASASRNSSCEIVRSPLYFGRGVLAMAAWTYLLLSEFGECYLGATTDLRKRLRAHNEKLPSRRYTSGRRWHLLAVIRFDTKSEAFSYESKLKRLRHRKIIWKLQNIKRACLIADRFGYSFDPQLWRDETHPRHVKAADKAGSAPYLMVPT